MMSFRPHYFMWIILACITIAPITNGAEYQLLSEDESLKGFSVSGEIQSPETLIAIQRQRSVLLTPEVTDKLKVGDTIILNLFADTRCIAHIDKVSTNINHTLTISGYIASHPYSSLAICTTGSQVLADIYVPDIDKRFIIRSEARSGLCRLIEMNAGQLPFSENEPPFLEGMGVFLDEGTPKDNQLEINPLEPANIDIMIIYTPAAYDDAASYFGGIDNYTASLINQANTVLANSQTYVTLTLVHSAMVDYVEDKTNVRFDPELGWISEDSIDVALRELTNEDGVMDEVHEWRDKYGADLVSLLLSRRVLRDSGSIAGFANQLSSASGNPAQAFSVAVAEYSSFTFVHEIGHNLGCGHSKYQSEYNYGGLFYYSYGWRWDSLCSVMSYPEGIYARIGIFSNPDIIENGVPAGDYDEADNSRTIRQTKHAVAAYRPHVDVNDVNEPEHIPLRIYVDANAPSGGNGKSWDTACKYLRNALLASENGDEIWVARGTYKPTDGTSDTANRKTVFILKNGVSVYGGFEGNETEREKRNWIENPTILSGDIGVPGSSQDNSLRIVLGADGSVLDGLTITGSYGDNMFYPGFGDGGGIYFYKTDNVTIANCVFDGNFSVTGAGIFMSDCNSASINNCTFKNNIAEMGGALIIYDSNVTIRHCEFHSNSAHDLYSFGTGGALLIRESDATIQNCILSGNSADSTGGGIEIYDCNATITNCTFAENMAGEDGGAIKIYGIVKVINSIFWDNAPSEITGEAEVDYSDIRGGWNGNGIGNIIKNPLFVNPGYWTDVNKPHAAWVNGDYHLKSTRGTWDSINKIWVQDSVTSPCIDTGDPNSDCEEELWPHGKRINMGAYGGTSQASMSPSDTGDIRDLNNDNSINWHDVSFLADRWNCSDIPLKADLDRNGIIDADDLSFFAGNWLENSSNAIPVLDFIDQPFIIKGNELSIPINAADSDGDKLIYVAFGLPDGADFSEQVLNWVPEKTGTYSVTFVVSDDKSLDYVTVRIIVE